MQVAFNGLLFWALQLLIPIYVECLLILANLPPHTILKAKQLVCYVASPQVPPAPYLGMLPPPLPDQPSHATRVWDAILVVEFPLDDPLNIAFI